MIVQPVEEPMDRFTALQFIQMSETAAVGRVRARGALVNSTTELFSQCQKHSLQIEKVCPLHKLYLPKV